MSISGFAIPTLSEAINFVVFIVIPIAFLVSLGIKLSLTFIFTKLHLIKSKNKINFFSTILLFLTISIYFIQFLSFPILLLLSFFAFVIFILLKIFDLIFRLEPYKILIILFFLLTSYFFFYPKKIYTENLNYQKNYREIKACNCFGIAPLMFQYARFCYGIPYLCKTNIDKKYCDPQCPIYEY